MPPNSLPQQLLASSLALLLTACQPDHAPATTRRPRPAPPMPAADTAQGLAFEAAQESPPTLSPALHRQIQENFARVNGVRKWSAVREEPLYDSTEGGVATFYDFDGQLWKVTARRYGETGQALTEYYLLRGQLSFVLETLYTYNRPIYWDLAHARENGDTEVFDFKKSTITATRSYFDPAGQLVAQRSPAARDSATVVGYLAREEQRLRTDLDTLQRQTGVKRWQPLQTKRI